MINLIPISLCLLGAGTDPPPVRRDTIVVTGVYEPIPLEDADRAVSVFDVGKQLLLSNAAVDLLQMDSSVDLRQRAPGGVQSDLSIRGGTFGQTLVLLDGLRLNDVQTGHFNLDVPIPMESISSIEVLRGSGSTLYGSDAVGGVVNFVTRAPEASEFRFRAAAGSFGVNQQRFSLSAVRGRFAQQLAGSRDFSSGFIPNRDYRNLSLVSNSHLTTGLGVTAVLLAHSDRPYGADNFYGNYNSWERTKTWFASMRQELGDRTEAAFAFRRHTDLFVLYRDRPQLFTNRHAVEGYQAALRRREDIGPNTRLHFGVQALRDSIASNNLGFHSRASGAAYAAVDFRALGRFSLSAGIREQIYGAGRSDISPSVAAGVWLSGRLKLKGSASRAFRLPSYTDLYYHDPANLGSPDLRPETAWSYEAGLDWDAGRRLRGDVTVFHRRESDGIDYVRRSESDIWRATNIQRLRFTGVETSLTAGIARSHQIVLRYTALNGSHAGLEGVFSRYVFNYPSHTGVVAWQAALPGSLMGRVRVGATKRAARDAYAVADVYLARGGHRVRPFLQLTNLTNSSYEEILHVPMPGRAIVGGLELVLFGPGK
jgi:iron complex outermembrane receptor protein